MPYHIEVSVVQRALSLIRCIFCMFTITTKIIKILNPLRANILFTSHPYYKYFAHSEKGVSR